MSVALDGVIAPQVKGKLRRLLPGRGRLRERVQPQAALHDHFAGRKSFNQP
jgi:hypothetical protein